MTPARYSIERFAQIFGYNRKVQRLGDAASEMHLLREAETQLGASIWEKAEPIETLADDYWSLRKRVRARAGVQKKLEQAEKAFQKSQGDATQNPTSEEHLKLIGNREELLAQQKQLSKEREETIREGDEVRSIHKGLKTKLEVFIDEGRSDSEIEKLSLRLNELRERFQELKQQNQSIAEKIANSDKAIDELGAEIKSLRNQDDVDAAASMKASSTESKEIWASRAELASLDRHIYKHYTAIGRYISRNISSNTDCSAAAKSHRGMVDVMKALRRSIALNHKLAGTHTPS